MPHPVFGLAIVGSDRIAEHEAAIRKQPGLHLSTRIGESSPGRESSSGTFGNFDFQAAGFRAVVVSTPASEREYWALQSARANKTVIIDGPLAGSSAGLLELRRLDQSMGEQVLMASTVLASDIASNLLEARGQIGRCLYVDLHMSIPKETLPSTRSGVAFLGATELLLLSERFAGPLDSVHARSRSLLTNRPSEDAVWAMLRFFNGAEGVLQVRGLDSTERVTITVHGTEGTLELSASLSQQTEKIRDRQYDNLVQVLTGQGKPVCGVRDIHRCLFLSTWMERSARQDRELFSSDVRVE